AMQWGPKYVPLNITVTPSHPTTIAANLARPYLGKYDFKWVEPEPDSAPADSAHAGHEGHSESGPPGPPPHTSFEVFYDKGSLWARVDPAPFPGMETMLLIQKADDW